MDTVSGEDVDITDCAKCRQLITDPTTLPCLDSLCAKCFSEVCDAYRDNSAGVAACPRCGDQFYMPISGRHSLPDRGFVDTLVTLRKIASQNLADDNCETCKQLATNSEPVVAAEFYCIECRLRICAVCCGPHRVFPLTKNHTVVGLGLDSAKRVLRMIQSSGPACGNHKDKFATIHCYQCYAGLCSECESVHSGHEFETLTDQTFSQLSDKVKSLRDQILPVHEKTSHVQKQLVDRRNGIRVAEKMINDKADEMISLIQRQRNELLNRLHSLNDQSVITAAEADSGRLSSASGTALKFTSELMDRGSLEDLLLNYHMLSDRVTKLCSMFNVSSVVQCHAVCSDDVSPTSLIHNVCTSPNSYSKSCCFFDWLHSTSFGLSSVTWQYCVETVSEIYMFWVALYFTRLTQ